MTALPGTVPAVDPARGSLGSRIRFALVPLWTAAWYLAWFALGRGPGGPARRSWVVRTWANGLLRILRIRVTARGPRPVPPFLLVSNHLSYLDVIRRASRVDTVFVAKREVRRWPLFGSAASAIGCIFIDRETPRDARRAGEAMRDAFQAGNGVVLFAEGTSSDGAGVLQLRSALLEWPAGENLPVHTAALSYHTRSGDPPASHALCWWGDMTFLPHLAGVCRLGWSEARVTFGAATVSATDRKDLARTARSAIFSDFTPSSTT